MIRQGIMLGICAGLLAGCGSSKKRSLELFDGHRFPARLERVSEDRRSFEITVREVSQSPAGAREAGRYQATRYCIEQFGSSMAEWEIGPDDENLPAVDNTLFFKGACAP